MTCETFTSTPPRSHSSAMNAMTTIPEMLPKTSARFTTKPMSITRCRTIAYPSPSGIATSVRLR